MTKAHLGWWAGERFWQCSEDVHNGGYSVGFHKCSKRAIHDPDKDGNPTKCGTHSESAVRKREAKRLAKYQAHKEAGDRKQKIANVKSEALEIITSIADGHNNPRELCRDWLDRLEKASQA